MVAAVIRTIFVPQHHAAARADLARRPRPRGENLGASWVGVRSDIRQAWFHWHSRKNGVVDTVCLYTSIPRRTGDPVGPVCSGARRGHRVHKDHSVKWVPATPSLHLLWNH